MDDAIALTVRIARKIRRIEFPGIMVFLP